MDVKQAIDIARHYVEDLFAQEGVADFELEEVERDQDRKAFRITLAFSRQRTAPRTELDEVLQKLGATQSRRRSYKVLTVSEDGSVMSMRNPQRAESFD